MTFQTKSVFRFLTVVFFFNSLGFCQSDSPLNTETFYSSSPSDLASPAPAPAPAPRQDSSLKHLTHKKTIVTAAGLTSVGTIVTAAMLFFLCVKPAGHRKKQASSQHGKVQTVTQTDEATVDRNDERLIVDENGLDAVYWRKLEAGKHTNSGTFRKDAFDKKPVTGWKRMFSTFSKAKSPISPSKAQVHPKEDQTVQPVQPPAPPPPPPPPMPAKECPAPPPQPPKGSSKPPPAPKRSPNGNVVEGGSEEKNDHVKLKALHWEKVNVVNRGHSMVWDKLGHGSFEYNDDMIETLFGSTATTSKSRNGRDSTAANNTAAKVFILDARRSQNVAIVIRSLAICLQELTDGLLEGKGLEIETLEKLTRMSPTKEEKIEILAFDGEVRMLADAESFLYRLLKAVPSAFTRVNAMLFRHTYDSEIQQLKDSLRTLDSACTELHGSRMFLKLLEATLKAGNRLNAGTSRGDATAFNLTALHKLSDYKSSAGKTTLLHFVVQEVVRNEGKRILMSNPSSSQDPEQEKALLELGLPVVSGLSAELLNVKKSATFDYDTLLNISTLLRAHIVETRQLVLQCENEGGQGDFVSEMKEFLGGAEEEIKAVQEEETQVMELVKKTTRYYQSGEFQDKQPLQLFAIVKDFIGMVDKACIDISRTLPQKAANSPPEVISTNVTLPRIPVGAQNSGSAAQDLDDKIQDAECRIQVVRILSKTIPDQLMSEKSNASDTDDEC